MNNAATRISEESPKAERPKIVLRPLAVTDLSLRYARRLEGNKIVHYRISSIPAIIGVPGFDAFSLVKEHILSFEPDAQVELADSFKMPEGLCGDVSAQVLTPHLRAELENRKVNAHLMQYLEIPDGPGFLQKVAHYASRIGLKKYVPSRYLQRRVSPASYLSYTYEETDEAEAFAALRRDLQILADRGLILGHLAIPSTMYLADTVGSGVLTKAVFCFPFVDQHKLMTQLGLDSFVNMPKLPLREIGVKSENYEGGLGQHISNGQSYEIEEVRVDLGTSESNRKAYEQNYLENREYVNDAASRQREAMDETTVSVESFAGDDRKVHIVTKFSK